MKFLPDIATNTRLLISVGMLLALLAIQFTLPC